ncbi:MAG TPA: phosphoglucosamine mutase [Gaiellaceae bacterium]|nr:phosphoglucosamine mutase [Gaiellaceae bacterium]
MTRRYFGTDGVRGVVGVDLTPDLVEQIGKAAALWAGGGRVLVGRDTRRSGPEFERSVARGISAAGGQAVLGGVLPTPAVAFLADDLGIVVSASHNPPEYNGVKVFRGGGKLVDEQEEEIESLLDAAAPGGGSIEAVADIAEAYVDQVVLACGSDLSTLRIGVDCANGAFSALAPLAFQRLGAEVHAIGAEPDGSNINVGCGATDLRALQHLVASEGLDLGVAFDGDGDRMLAVDEHGEVVDGDQTLAILALALGVDVVAVTVMTNFGFHALMEESDVRVVTTPVGDRYVSEALRREGGLLGGEQSGHVIWLGNHATGDGLAAALLLCRALEGRSLSQVASTMPRFPQAKRNVAVTRRQLTPAIVEESDRLNAELGARGRVLVRPSGTEPVVRVLAEAETTEDAEKLCASIAALVERELG